MSTDVQHRLVERFLRYSAITSTSDASATTVPSSPGQRELADLLADELRTAGALDVHLSETSVLTARIPSNLPEGRAVPAVGFCVHLDVVDVDLSPVVRPHVVEHHGGDVLLNQELDLWIRRDEHPELDRYIGDRLLVGDGTSVLGADDKAGLASVMEAAVAWLQPEAPPHGDVYLAIVPDEEIGLRGVRTLDLRRFPVAYAWTLDCCELGEVVTETFNAATATIRVAGVAAHPMSAKGVLVNPILVAHDVVALLDRTQTPECTEGREGYLWVNGIDGNQTSCTVTISIRDHDRDGYLARKQMLRDVVEQVRSRHPRATIEVEIVDVYANIADALTEATRPAVDCLFAALDELGITPVHRPMRGGTDGSWLSAQGIVTPNFFTGAHNFHSTAEFLPLKSFESSHRVVLELVRQVTKLPA